MSVYTTAISQLTKPAAKYGVIHFNYICGAKLQCSVLFVEGFLADWNKSLSATICQDRYGEMRSGEAAVTLMICGSNSLCVMQGGDTAASLESSSLGDLYRNFWIHV